MVLPRRKLKPRIKKVMAIAVRAPTLVSFEIFIATKLRVLGLKPLVPACKKSVELVKIIWRHQQKVAFQVNIYSVLRSG